MLGFLVEGTGGAFVPTTGIPTAQLDDPVDLAFRPSSSEVFVSNRHGAISIGGFDGSVSRFLYDAVTRTFTSNGSFPVPGPAHQMTFNPIDGELFVAMLGPEFGFLGGVARFTFDTSGAALPNGELNTGTTRGVAVSPDGERLYITTAADVIRQFDLTDGGAELTPVIVAGSPNLHFMNILNGQLYAAAFGSSEILRYDIEANNDLTIRDATPASFPISVAFSPDGLEMYAAGHLSSSELSRFTYDPILDVWVPTTPFPAGSSLGGILILP